MSYILILGGRETSLSDLVIPPELYSDNLTNTSSGTPTRFQIFNETEQQKIIEKHVRLGAVSEVRYYLHPWKWCASECSCKYDFHLNIESNILLIYINIVSTINQMKSIAHSRYVPKAFFFENFLHIIRPRYDIIWEKS